MEKRLQVFISSTFEDLRKERQAAVEAILTAKCIPAGMESFTGENTDQLERIYKWIDESDIFLLIVGARYGSIRKDKGLSYTHLEYLYAKEKNKQMIICVMKADNILKIYKNAKEKDEKSYKYYTKYLNEFKKFRISLYEENKIENVINEFYSTDNLKLILLGSLYEIKYNTTKNFIGWVRGNEIPNKKILHNAEMLNKLGIKQIYAKPRERDIEKEISTAKKIFFITYAGNNFIHKHRQQLIKALNNGASIYIIISGKNIVFSDAINSMEGLSSDEEYLYRSLDATYNEIEAITKLANKCNRVEIRSYMTELRNSIIMYKDKNDNFTAFLTIMFGYKNASECMMLEFNGGQGLKDCKAYFEKVWNSRKHDVIFKNVNGKKDNSIIKWGL